MENLFVPENLVLQKDGSVKPRDYGKDIKPKENETFTEFYTRYHKELSHLKDYQKNMQIPYEQQKELYKVQIFSMPTKITQKEEAECLQPRLMFEKLFLEKEVALKYATNKIKQQSVGYYYSKDNLSSRQYKFSYIIIHGTDDVETKSAINGKII